MNLDALAATWSPRLLSVLRIMSGLLLLQHGTAKLLGFPVVPNFANTPLTSLSGIAGILELVGGVLLILGLSRGRPPSSCRVCAPWPTSLPTRRAASIPS